MHSAKIAVWFTCVAAPAALAGTSNDVVMLPRYEVSADVIAKMIPREQLAEISREAGAFETFRFAEVAMAKAPFSQFQRAVKCLVRDKNGRVLQDITNDQLTVAIDNTWTNGFLSSNQPAEYSIFYLLLRPQWQGQVLSIGVCRQLLQDYIKFSEARLREAEDHYGSARFSISNLYWYTVPDEVAIVFRSREIGTRVARLVGASEAGPLVRINQTNIEQLIAEHGAQWPLAATKDIACMTPWGSVGPPPETRNGAAMFPVGWIVYQRNQLPHGVSDLIGVGMWLPH